jgi:hypothetical protein
MRRSRLEPIQVMRGDSGPFPGVRLGDAIRHGALSWADALDALGRWQRFLDRHLHNQRFPTAGWSDFPPAAIAPLADLPAPLAAHHRR